MKTTKRVFALVLAAMMLAMMIPFAASAANNSLTLSMSHKRHKRYYCYEDQKSER